MSPGAQLVDIHVHIVGTGRGGSGCWLKVSGYHRLLANYILRDLGLPGSLLRGNLEEHYVPKVASLVRSSSLDKAVILAQDRVYDENGRVIENFGSFYVPNEYVLSLVEQYSEFLAGVSIHPARPDALDELDRCVARGAVLMKCLPNCHNINCSDNRYRKFWQKMADYRLPLLAHTGGELSVPVYDKRFADPRTLTLPLECGVTVIAAHCGTNSLMFDKNYLQHFVTLLKKYSNLYGDNSGMQTPFRSRHFATLLRQEIGERLVHGSDLPIPISGQWARLRGLIDRDCATRAAAEPNPLERDIVLKRGMGFGDETFTRASRILRPFEK